MAALRSDSTGGANSGSASDAGSGARTGYLAKLTVSTPDGLLFGYDTGVVSRVHGS